MKLSITNMAWDRANDAEMLAFLQGLMYAGIEVAPSEVTDFGGLAYGLWDTYRLEICAFNDIWRGRTENIFDMEQRNTMAIFTRDLIDKAAAARCKNLIFDCPMNRIAPMDAKYDKVDIWFKELGDYAASKGVAIAIQACPSTYGTNFLNTTREVFEYIKKIGSPGLKVSVDFSAMLENEEGLNDLLLGISLISHIQINEPAMGVITQRAEHVKLADILNKNNYSGLIGVEMKNPGDIEMVKSTAKYMAEIFG